MKKEYIEDALSAITSAYSQDEIIGLYLAGYSLGAVITPSIVQFPQNVDGLILLSPVIRRHAELVYNPLLNILQLPYSVMSAAALFLPVFFST